jgi:ubiquitin C-terminal hydrolase
MYYLTVIKEMPCKNCNKTNYSIESFIDICLQTYNHKSNKDISLEELLDDFFSEQYFDYGQLKCEHCHSEAIASMRIKILHLPKILTIWLDRIDIVQRGKDNRLLKPITSLNLKDYLFKKNDELTELKSNYTLYGGINHYGSTFGGHYVAHCIYDGEIIKYNDQTTSQVNHHSMFNGMNGLFFYQAPI